MNETWREQEFAPGVSISSLDDEPFELVLNPGHLEGVKFDGFTITIADHDAAFRFAVAVADAVGALARGIGIDTERVSTIQNEHGNIAIQIGSDALTGFDPFDEVDHEPYTGGVCIYGDDVRWAFETAYALLEKGRTT